MNFQLLSTFVLCVAFIFPFSSNSCHFDVDIIQSHHVGNSPIVSSPLVADIDADGTLDIITTTFDGTIDVVDGENMKPHSRSQWPYQFPNSTVHASPMLVCIKGHFDPNYVVYCYGSDPD